MCTSPLHIGNNSVYKSLFYSFKGYDVPCGSCEECRNSKKADWQTRISFEISSLYRRGGCAVFLTFTYSDKCLPHYKDGDFCVSCFNHKDVLRFLNRLKVNAYRHFGKGSYKYFVTSEYGKNTKRPHYHGLFFLQPNVNFHEFTEICRDAWTYGYMFPKFNKYKNAYVDNNNAVVTPCIRSLVGGAKYVSKYVTKDLSFYELPCVAAYIADDENKERMRPYLPKHWQSNLLGLSVLDDVSLMDDKDVDYLLNVGVTNPLTFKVVPCPQFIVNKLMYRNVKSSRISPITGKVLYDRFLTDFGKRFMYSIFRSRIAKYSSKMSKIFQLAISDPCRFNLQCYDFSNLSKVGVLDYTDSSQFVSLAVYHLFWKMSSVFQLRRFLKDCDGAAIDLFDVDKVFPYWLKAKDALYLKNHSFTYGLDFKRANDTVSNSLFYKLMSVFASLDEVFAFVSTKISFDRNEKMRKDYEELQDFKDKFCRRFDKRLC